jgi:fumarate reductase subunit D
MLPKLLPSFSPFARSAISWMVIFGLMLLVFSVCRTGTHKLSVRLQDLQFAAAFHCWWCSCCCLQLLSLLSVNTKCIAICGCTLARCSCVSQALAGL